MTQTIDVTKVKLTPMSLLWLAVALFVVIALTYGAHAGVKALASRSQLFARATGDAGASRGNGPPAAMAALRRN